MVLITWRNNLQIQYGVVSLVVKPRVVIPLSRVRFSYDSPVDHIVNKMYNNVMYKVINKKIETKFDSLHLAMEFAKTVGTFVTIEGPGFEVVGIFGTDTIKDGKCPDGIDYTWKKRRA